MLIRIAAAFAVVLSILFASTSASADFSENPIVYFLITDRFFNGNPANDHAYGRKNDGASEIGTFHGGDLAGVTQKLKSGWFSALGVNAIWLSAPFEQIHGWVVGGNAEFKHYAYHGYYTTDFTVLDSNMGTVEELRELVDTAHSQGIRVLFDVVMNHPGYLDIQSAIDFKIPVIWRGAEKAELGNYHEFIDYNADKKKWAQWWGGAWVRAGLPGYTPEGTDDYTKQVAYLPDFRTDSKEFVSLPPFLKRKSDTRAVELQKATVRDYLVGWLAEWVREYGVDGFRCDTVKHVEPAAWKRLKAEAVAALSDWKAKHPDKKIDDEPFWMVGEYWGQGIEKSPLYGNGFDALINFDFQGRVSSSRDLDSLFHDYAARLSGKPGYNVLSYLSSHDTRLYPRNRLIDGGTALLLAPGGVQIFYGDETARPNGPTVPSDAQQATRSDMNWNSINQTVLAHWSKLTRFRARHPALARGAHHRLATSPYVFSRVIDGGGDAIVAALGATGEVDIPVAGVFKEGAQLVDAYSGRESTVINGKVHLLGESVVLLEERR
ncbi:hypothetical protein GCM10025771_36320 [Niveibacterium umoris]|uniref:Alpha-amylase n=1 Tax=Niveibacterium umoris TaxID=1193620 RepID=A0A840BDR4_9RHOO|nr:alpha-amylase family glycosyl hydrolase [Niveibacterium umoris]MBB4011170.1 alpha-amylase [Niveibacterium umoris]